MSSLYPDESYCTSDIGRILFQPKTEWSVTGKVLDVAEVKQITGSHVEYQIELKVILTFFCLPLEFSSSFSGFLFVC